MEQKVVKSVEICCAAIRLYRQVDVTGFPTREGLVRLYAEGVQERGYHLATAAASQQCLQTAHQRRLRSQPSEIHRFLRFAKKLFGLKNCRYDSKCWLRTVRLLNTFGIRIWSLTDGSSWNIHFCFRWERIVWTCVWYIWMYQQQNFRGELL